jgi:hypothetical protein
MIFVADLPEADSRLSGGRRGAFYCGRWVGSCQTAFGHMKPIAAVRRCQLVWRQSTNSSRFSAVRGMSAYADFGHSARIEHFGRGWVKIGRLVATFAGPIADIRLGEGSDDLGTFAIGGFWGAIRGMRTFSALRARKGVNWPNSATNWGR